MSRWRAERAFNKLIATRANGVLELRANYSKQDLEDLSLRCLCIAFNLKARSEALHRKWGRRTTFIHRMINQLVGPIPRN